MRLGGGELLVGEALAGADGLDGEAAVEDEHAIDLVGLAAGHEGEADSALAQPAQCGGGLADELGGEAVVDQALGDAGEVVAELRGGVGADIDAGDLGLAEVGDQLLDIGHAVVGEAKAAAGEVGVAAALGLGRLFEHEDLGALLAGADRGAERGVPGAHDNHSALL